MHSSDVNVETFNINKFLYYEMNNEVIIQSSNGICKITNTNMVNLIKDWEFNLTQKITINDLKNIFKEDTLDAIEFLESYKIIEKIKEKNLEIDGIIILSNNDSLSMIVKDTITNQFLNTLKVISINPDDISIEVLENKFIIVLLNPYDKKFAEKLIEMQKKIKNSVTLMGYVYTNNFYLDSLYSYDWKVPCHNCHMGHIQTSMYAGEDHEITYQQLIDILYSETENAFQVGAVLDAVQEFNIACLVINKVNQYIGDFSKLSIHPQNLNKCLLMNLKSLKKYEDTSIFWEMCDCYE